MFEGELNSVEAAYEKVRFVIDQDEWRTNLVAMHHLAAPFQGLIQARAPLAIDPLMSPAAAMVQCATQLSLLLSLLPKEQQTQYAFATMIFALVHRDTLEKMNDERTNDPSQHRGNPGGGQGPDVPGGG